MERYKHESLQIASADEKQRISGFIHGIRTRQLVKEMSAKVPKTLEEAFERTEAYLRGEEAAMCRDSKITQAAQRGPMGGGHTHRPLPSTQRPWLQSSSYDGGDRRGSPYERPNHNRRQETFTALTKTSERY